jgi:hypothetical protein
MSLQPGKRLRAEWVLHCASLTINPFHAEMQFNSWVGRKENMLDKECCRRYVLNMPSKPPSWAAGEGTKRARGSPNKVREGSDGRIKSTLPTMPAIGGRHGFSVSNGLNRALNRSIGRCWLA